MPNKHETAKLNEFQKQVSIGSLLGDMSASKPSNGRNYHLSCYHAEKQVEWLCLKWSWLQPYSRPIQYCEYTDKRDGKTRKGARFHTISAPCFTELAKVLYVEGRKTILPNLIELFIHPVALACLICDDGSWDHAGISIASKQFSLIENQILADCLGQNFGLNATVLENGKYFYTRITARSVEKAKGLCSPYVPDFLTYKFGPVGYHSFLVGKINKICPVCKTEFLTYESNHRTYCNRRCAMVGRLTGYATRAKVKICPICHSQYTPYNRKQLTCLDCRDKPFVPIVCGICGKPLMKRGQKYCRGRCAVIACHKAQGHTIHC